MNDTLQIRAQALITAGRYIAPAHCYAVLTPRDEASIFNSSPLRFHLALYRPEENQALNNKHPAPSCFHLSAFPLEPALESFRLRLVERPGLLLITQTDLAGRMAGYGFHWHMPDDQGDCTNPVCFTYATPLDALAAGILAGFAAGLTIAGDAEPDALERAGELIGYCQVSGEREP
jgi:hypothetical protein